MATLNDNYWERRYKACDTPWDIGYASPPICNFIYTLTQKDTAILIPGAGKAHEAAFLWEHGFRNFKICDWAVSAFDTLLEKIPEFPRENCLIQDFFELSGKFDLILEQTFFCAIDPSLRKKYVEKCSELLVPKGKVAGLLFAKKFDKPGPPFGGSAEEYQKLFGGHFYIDLMIEAKDSITPRAGSELFFIAEKYN